MVSECDNFFGKLEIDSVSLGKLRVQLPHLFVILTNAHAVVAKIKHQVPEQGNRDETFVLTVIEVKCILQIIYKI